MVAGKKTASEYVAEWRKASIAIDTQFANDPALAASAYAAELEAEFTRERLQEYVQAGGYTPDPALVAATPNDGDADGAVFAGTATVVFAPSGLRTEVDCGTTILDAARRVGADLDSVCGGRGICGRCQVLAPNSPGPDSPGPDSPASESPASESLSPWSSTEAAYTGRRPLKNGARLGCAALVQGDVTVEIPVESQVHRPVIRKTVDLTGLVVDPVVRLFYVQIPPAELGTERGEVQRLRDALCEQWKMDGEFAISMSALRALQPALAHGEGSVTVAIHGSVSSPPEIIGVWPGFVDSAYGAAFDVGSTTIAGHLCDLATGEIVASAGVMNPQIRFGEDLMSRVSYVMMHPGGEVELTHVVQSALDELITTLTHDAGVGRDAVLDIVVVGNPIMHHLVLGIDPTPLGTAPFSLATDEPVDVIAETIGIHCGFAQVHLLPCIAGHVGADTAAAVLAEGPHRRDDITLLIDVGTNAEIVLGNRERLYAASSPTGPAFEGAQISCGQRATSGAIERVRVDKQTLEPTLTVIGGDVPITGVCGSGIIEVIGELLLAGVITTDGTISGDAAQRSPRIVADGRTFSYVLHDASPRLLITQNDVRAIQLAKAALWAGARLLMDHAGIDRVDRVALAGAFGSHIDPVYALLLGLIPDTEPETVVAIGNAAGSGAVRALLSAADRAEIAAVARTITKIETAIEPAFQAHFVGAMGIPHTTDPYTKLGAVIELPAPSSANASTGRPRRRARTATPDVHAGATDV